MKYKEALGMRKKAGAFLPKVLAAMPTVIARDGHFASGGQYASKSELAAATALANRNAAAINGLAGFIRPYHAAAELFNGRIPSPDKADVSRQIRKNILNSSKDMYGRDVLRNRTKTAPTITTTDPDGSKVIRIAGGVPALGQIGSYESTNAIQDWMQEQDKLDAATQEVANVGKRYDQALNAYRNNKPWVASQMIRTYQVPVNIARENLDAANKTLENTPKGNWFARTLFPGLTAYGKAKGKAIAAQKDYNQSLFELSQAKQRAAAEDRDYRYSTGFTQAEADYQAARTREAERYVSNINAQKDAQAKFDQFYGKLKRRGIRLSARQALRLWKLFGFDSKNYSPT